MAEKPIAAGRGAVVGRAAWSGYHLLPAAVCLLFIGLAAFVVSAEPSTVVRVLEEGGPIESMSAAGYTACLLVIAAFGGAGFLLRRYEIAILLLFLSSRELDFDKRFSTTGIFKTEFYASAGVPLLEKLIAGAVTLFLVWAAVRLISASWRDFANELRRLHPGAVSFTLAIACLGIAKTFDGIQRKLADYGFTISDEASYLFTTVEEVLELSAPLFLIAAAVAYLGLRRRLGSRRAELRP